MTQSREPLVASPAAARPLFLEPRSVARPWGGRRVASRYGWSAGSETIGEWWLASSYPGTETTVRGQRADLALWLDGPGSELGCPSGSQFPLLLKFLDCGEVLSAQVHPDDMTASMFELPCGKTEAWHVLDAEPGAGVYLGLARGVKADDFFDAIQDGATDDAVRRMLHFIEAKPGDTFHVAAGTVHAVGGGLSLFEVQQNSDTTYRIHDWGRGRDIHLEEARASTLDVGPGRAIDTASAPTDADGWATLVSDPAFVMRRGALGAGSTRRCGIAPGRNFALLTVLSGTGTLRTEVDGDGIDAAPLQPGDTALLFGPSDIVAASDLDILVCDPPQ